MSDNPKAQEPEATKKTVWRKWLKASLWGLLSLFVLIVLLLLLFTDRIVENALKDAIYIESDGIYTIEFDEIDFYYKDNTLEITALKLIPDTTKARIESGISDERTLYEIAIQKIQLKQIKLSDLYYRNRLLISDIHINNPALKVMGSDSTSVHKPGKHFSDEFRGLILNYLNRLEVDRFVLSGGVFDFYNTPGDPVASSSIDSVSLYLSGFIITPVDTLRQNRILFSDEVEINISNYEKHLRDSLHILTINKVSLSSNDQVVLLDSLQLRPEEDSDMDASYSLTIPEMKCTGVDIENLFLHRKLYIDSILVKNPDARFIHSNTGRRNETQAGSRPIAKILYSHIKNDLVSLDLNELEIVGADVSLASENSSMETIGRLGNASLSLSNFLLDSVSAEAGLNSVFKGESKIEIGEFRFYDEYTAHEFTGDNLSIATHPPLITVDSLSVTSSDNARSSIDGMIPRLDIRSFDIQDILNKNELNFGNITLYDPDVSVVIHPPDSGLSHHHNSLSVVSVDSSLIRNGDIRLEIKKDSNSSYKVNGNLDVLVDALTYRPKSTNNTRTVSFNDLDLKVGEAEFSLDDKERVTISRIRINSFQKTALFNQVRFDDSQTGENALSYIEIESFLCRDFDPARSLKNHNVFVGAAEMKKPTMKIRIDTIGRKSHSLLQNHRIIKDKVQAYLQSFVIEDLTIDDLAFEIDYIDPVKEPLFINNISARFDHLVIDSIQDHNSMNMFFAEDFSIRINDLQEGLNDEIHGLSIGQIEFSKSGKSIHLSDIDISPEDRNKPGASFYVKLPEVEVLNADFDKYFFDDEVSIGTIIVKNPDMKLRLDTISHKTKAPHQPLTFSLPSFSGGIHIENIQLNDGRLNVHRSVLPMLGADFDIDIQQLEFDTSRSFRLFKDTLPIRDLSLRLANLNGLTISGFYQFRIDSVLTRLSEKEADVFGFDLSNPEKDNLRESLIRKKERSSFAINMPHLGIKGIDVTRFFAGHGLLVSSIEIDNTKLGVSELKDVSFPPESKKLFHPALSGPFSNMQVNRLKLNDIDLSMTRFYNDTVKVFNISDISGMVSELMVDSASINNSDRILFSDNIELTTRKYSVYSSDSMYTFYAGNISLSTAEELIKVDSFRVKPNYPVYEFSRKLGYQTDRMDIEINSILAHGFDFDKMLNEGKVDICKFDMSGFMLEAFRDKRVTFPEWHRSPMPQDLLRKLPFDLYIDTLDFDNMHLTYGEMVEKAREPGHIHFNNMHGTVLNITNDSLRIMKNNAIALHMEGLLMNQGELDAHLHLLMNHPNDTFAFHASLSRMDLSDFNSLSRNLFGVAIKKGKGRVDSLLIFGNKEYETGYLMFPYRKFRIQMVNRHTGRQGGIGSGILTFLANNILLKSNNPRFGKPVRKGVVFYRRDPHKSILNYLWKGTLSGVESTLGYNNRNQRKEIKAYKEERK